MSIDVRLARLGAAIGKRLTGELAPAPAAAGGAAEREVHKDPAGVRNRVLHPPDARPAAGHLQQRLLHQVLGLGQVPDDQVRGAEQRIGALRHEAVEIGSPVVHLPLPF